MPPRKQRRDADHDDNGADCKKRRKPNPASTAANGAQAYPEEDYATPTEPVLEGDKFSGEVLMCGGTNWDLTGRKALPKGAKSVGGRNLWGPHRIASLKGIEVRTVASGCLACHSVILTTSGQAYSWGRNDRGQLGHGDLDRRDSPTLISRFEGLNVVHVACGRSHTLFVTDTGTVFGVGANNNGQLGLGTQGPDVLTPAKVQFKGPPIRRVACGAEFSVVSDIVGNLYTFGSPEFGQLGHNTDGKYFVTSSKLGHSCETRPRRVMVFIDRVKDGQITAVADVEITDIACGTNHVVVLDKKERVYTWGFGGYGRLGHSETKDELVPRLVKFFDGPNRGATMIGAGSTYTLAVNKLGALYCWGQTKSSGEANMYPKPVHDLSGWAVRGLGCSNKSIVVLADNSIVSWGTSPTYGELGYGADGVKSSTTPQEMKTLEGAYVVQVSCGFGHTLLLARNTSDDDKAAIERIPEYTP